jgi:hypothetical protein
VNNRVNKVNHPPFSHADWECGSGRHPHGIAVGCHNPVYATLIAAGARGSGRSGAAEIEVPSLWVFQLIVPMANAREGRIHDHPLRRSVGI